MEREPTCESCGAVIIAVLSEQPSANGYLCLKCSGAALGDFLEESETEEDYIANQVEMLRTFHGSD